MWLANVVLKSAPKLIEYISDTQKTVGEIKNMLSLWQKNLSSSNSIKGIDGIAIGHLAILSRERNAVFHFGVGGQQNLGEIIFLDNDNKPLQSDGGRKPIPSEEKDYGYYGRLSEPFSRIIPIPDGAKGFIITSDGISEGVNNFTNTAELEHVLTNVINFTYNDDDSSAVYVAI
ncbi:MAG TPA: hypothetical protein VGA67_03075 [Candidatus Dojkabacteria bacterium]